MRKPKHAKNITQKEWREMDEKTQKWMAARSNPGVMKHKPGNSVTPKNGSRDDFRAGWCPCDICGHTWMWECEEAAGMSEDDPNWTRSGCHCCSGPCT